MRPRLSVIICSHNPRSDYIHRTLDALRRQTLPLEQWQLSIVDNASDVPLATFLDVNWHPYAGLTNEPTLGLISARITGIRQSVADLVVFVDDDNLLAPDYLEEVLRISDDWPQLGVWGGQTIPEFEVEPPSWTKPYWGYLALHEFSRDRWGNVPGLDDITPCGAGMCVRREVALHFVAQIDRDPRQATLGRKGRALLSAEDASLAYLACDIGFGVGRFAALRLTHLIPASRITEEYLIRLVEGIGYSVTFLHGLRGKVPSEPSRSDRILQWYQSVRLNGRQRRFYLASEQGRLAARKDLQRLLK